MSQTSSDILTAYNPQAGTRLLLAGKSLAELSKSNKAPSLASLQATAGQAITIEWINIQLQSLSDFAGQSKGLTQAQREETALLILARYYFLNLAELSIFFAKCKAGDYGEFYGSVDPTRILARIPRFLRERSEVIDHYESKQRAKEREAEMQGTISYEEYIALKAQAEAGNQEAQRILNTPKKQH